MCILCLRYKSLILLFLVIVSYTLQKKKPVTLSVQERVELLKVQIADQIREKQHRSELITPVNDGDDYQYVDIENKPMTPINEFDDRKKDSKYQLREIVTPPTTEMDNQPVMIQRPIERMRKKKKRGKSKKRLMRPVETFYRRKIYNEDILYSPMKLLHCHELFTPILAGYRKNISTYKTGPVKFDNLQVQRMVHLLRKNTSRYTREEVTSLLYQLSNIPMRLFEFDLDALKLILDTITKGRAHTWRNIKLSVAELIEEWKLDLSNTSTLLNQAKIYRPPCVTITGYEGSTKTSSGVKYSKITSSKTTCADNMEKKRADDYDDYDERLYH